MSRKILLKVRLQLFCKQADKQMHLPIAYASVINPSDSQYLYFIFSCDEIS